MWALQSRRLVGLSETPDSRGAEGLAKSLPLALNHKDTTTGLASGAAGTAPIGTIAPVVGEVSVMPEASGCGTFAPDDQGVAGR
jgi:hypothetical protein